MNKFLFKQIDNSSLIVFRILFGLLIFLESVGAIFTGWIKRTMVEPDFTFNFIGFDWLQPLPGDGMYYYYLVMGIFGIFVMIGYKYRWSMIAFTLMWASTYYMQKASYNNHYYLLILLSTFMCFVPANRYLSVDAKLNPEIKSIKMPNWSKWIFIIQMTIVYTYASVAKLYPDWLDTTVIKQLMLAKKHYYVIGDLLQNNTLHYFIAYAGILYDGLVIPLLLYKPTRKFAIACSFVFHIFNSIVFQVGIFPFLSLGFILFFLDQDVVHRLFLKKKPFYQEENEVIVPKSSSYVKPIFITYFIIQILLPLRHWTIEDSVLRTEEGHRLSWRMMLRTKSGVIAYKVVDKATGKSEIINHRKMVSRKQSHLVATKPDVIWQFAQRLKKQYKEKGQDIEVYAIHNKISINGKGFKPFIDPNVDLAAAKWDFFRHNTWILDPEEEKKSVKEDVIQKLQ